MFVVISGEPENGFTVFGPFKTDEEAANAGGDLHKQQQERQRFRLCRARLGSRLFDCFAIRRSARNDPARSHARQPRQTERTAWRRARYDREAR